MNESRKICIDSPRTINVVVVVMTVLLFVFKITFIRIANSRLGITHCFIIFSQL
jgi:hypothetical protein